jgi:hypothetical protein
MRVVIFFQDSKVNRLYGKMKYYAEGIRKFERQLCLPVSAFSVILKENDLDNTKQKEEGTGAINES